MARTKSKKATSKKATSKKAASKKAPAAKAGGRPMAKGGPAPQARPPAGASAGVRVRMYRVGFGDFFLVSVPGNDGAYKHILVDCGVHAADLNSIGAAIDDLVETTGQKLALVIMTHRHADHISGFGRGKDKFAQFAVERVWMPWFESRTDDKAKNFQLNLLSTVASLERQLALRAAPGDAMYRNMMTNILGAAGAGNAAALDVLHGGFKNKAPVDYYKAGDTPTLPPSLVDAQVTAKILGPPTDATLIAQMDNKSHQYLSAPADQDDGPVHPFASVFVTDADAYPKNAFSLFEPDQVQRAVAEAQPDMLAARAQKADNTINNQSLVVLFEVGGKKLLFVGDAQWGNWSNFLFGGKLGTNKHGELAADSKEILSSIDFYKVGHHGSTNATPIDALDAMRCGCVAMCSTEPGAYGSPANNSEVPRKPLIAAIVKRTEDKLAQSTQVAVAGSKASGGALASVFKAGAGYIDYFL